MAITLVVHSMPGERFDFCAANAMKIGVFVPANPIKEKCPLCRGRFRCQGAHGKAERQLIAAREQSKGVICRADEFGNFTIPRAPARGGDPPVGALMDRIVSRREWMSPKQRLKFAVAPPVKIG